MKKKEFDNIIKEKLEGFEYPSDPPLGSWSKVKGAIPASKKSKEQTKVIPLKTYWYAVAASVIVIIGLFIGLNSTSTYTTQHGEHLAITLPDGSTVRLNAASKLSYKRFFWKNNRTIHLEGEGYFEVEKGKKFTVSTSYGTVAVLGTKFNVKSRTQSFEVNCFEGTVRFDNAEKTAYNLLYENDHIEILDNVLSQGKANTDIPSWVNGMSTFEERPLQEVIEELQLQYNITFKSDKTDLTKVYSGTFIHDNLEIALKTTLSPMGIPYTLSKDKTTVRLP